jgi:hypothetical protein
MVVFWFNHFRGIPSGFPAGRQDQAYYNKEKQLPHEVQALKIVFFIHLHEHVVIKRSGE